MRRGRWNLLAAGAGTLGVVLLAIRGLSGCYSAVPNDGLIDAGPPKMSDAKLPEAGADSGFVGPGGPCDGGVGVLPAPNCFSGGTLACTPSSTCSLGTVATCGETSCLPMVDNAKTTPPGTYNFRMAALNITAPKSLMNPLVDPTIAGGVNLDAPSCGYGPAVDTTGAFSWLISVDKKTNGVMTGGGGPSMDPYTTGYCWVKGMFGTSPVTPITFPSTSVTFKGNTFSTAPYKGTLYVPIFATITMTSNPIVLPLQGVQFSNVGISPDGNCIGDINPEWPAAAGSTCNKTLPPTCPKWFTNGSLGGYITLKDANEITIPVTEGTLCALLVPPTAGVPLNKPCPTSDYNMGDYCSTTQSPGGCNDSVWLSATFAANAVKIYESNTAPCGE